MTFATRNEYAALTIKARLNEAKAQIGMSGSFLWRFFILACGFVSLCTATALEFGK